MIVREGKSVFKGVAIGKIFVYKKADNAVKRRQLQIPQLRWLVLKQQRRKL